MKEFWDQRYNTEEYVYGKEPNEFFRENIVRLKPGKLFLPGEGEGRNAVFAATLGWEVTAYDYSTQGKKKAENLAKQNHVKIDYRIATHEEFEADRGSFDCIALIYAHPEPGQRTKVHRKLAGLLKPGGILIFEGFSKEQIYNNTGGPRNVDMLFSEEDLKNDFIGFIELEIIKTEIDLREGGFHQGVASVIRITGIK